MAANKPSFSPDSNNTSGGGKIPSANSSDSLFEVLETIAPLHVKDYPDWIIISFGEKVVIGGKEMQQADGHFPGVKWIYTADLSEVNLAVKGKPTQKITDFNYLSKYEIGGKEMIMAYVTNRKRPVLLYTADWSEVHIKDHPKLGITHFGKHEKEIGGKKICDCKINHDDNNILYIYIEDFSEVTIKNNPQKKITTFGEKTVKINGREIIHCGINDTDEGVRLDTKDFSEIGPLKVKDSSETEITDFFQTIEIGGKTLQYVQINSADKMRLNTEDCSEANLTIKDEPTEKITHYYDKKVEILGKKIQRVTINHQGSTWVNREDLSEVPLTVKDHPELKITDIDEFREIGDLQRFAINYSNRIWLNKKDLQAVTLPGISGYVHTIEHAEGHPGALYFSIGHNKYLVKPKNDRKTNSDL